MVRMEIKCVECKGKKHANCETDNVRKQVTKVRSLKVNPVFLYGRAIAHGDKSTSGNNRLKYRQEFITSKRRCLAELDVGLITSWG